MKKVKAMAAIAAASATMAMGALPVCAADQTPDAQAMQAAVLADEEVQAEVQARATESATTSAAFNWNGLAMNQTGTLSASAYKVDLSATSMANNSLASGSAVMLIENGYEFTVNTQSYEYMGLSAQPKSASVTYYEAQYDDDGDITGYEEVTKDCTVLQSENQITFTIPADAKGLTSVDKPAGYNNMIKVKMMTTLDDSWVSGIFPESMINPTFFYLFNVAPKN